MGFIHLNSILTLLWKTLFICNMWRQFSGLILVTQRPKLKSTSPYFASQGTVEGKYDIFIFPFPVPSLDIIFICFEQYLGLLMHFGLQKHLPY